MCAHMCFYQCTLMHTHIHISTHANVCMSTCVFKWLHTLLAYIYDVMMLVHYILILIPVNRNDNSS